MLGNPECLNSAEFSSFMKLSKNSHRCAEVSLLLFIPSKTVDILYQCWLNNSTRLHLQILRCVLRYAANKPKHMDCVNTWK